jgi:hypothetical protein
MRSIPARVLGGIFREKTVQLLPESISIMYVEPCTPSNRALKYLETVDKV